MPNPLENAEQNSAAIPQSDNIPPYTYVPLLGTDSPFAKLRPKAAIVPLNDLYGFASYTAKTKSLALEKVSDYRKLSTICKRIGGNERTLAKQLKAIAKQVYIVLTGGRRRRTYKKSLTKKATVAFGKKCTKTIPIPLALLQKGLPFAKMYVLAYLAYRSGCFSETAERNTGVVFESYVEIAANVGLSLSTVQRAVEVLVSENWFTLEMVVGKDGGKDLRLYRTSAKENAGWCLFPVLSDMSKGAARSDMSKGAARSDMSKGAARSDMSKGAARSDEKAPCRIGSSAMSKGAPMNPSYGGFSNEEETLRYARSAPPLDTSGASASPESADNQQSETSSETKTNQQPATEKLSAKENNPATESVSSSEKTISQQQADLETTCSAIAKHARTLCWNPQHQEWFLKIRLTAAHIELHAPALLSENKITCCPQPCLEPFRYSLQRVLSFALSQVTKKDDSEKFCGFLRKMQNNKFSASAVKLLKNSKHSRLIEQHFPELLRRIEELRTQPTPQMPLEAASTPQELPMLPMLPSPPEPPLQPRADDSDDPEPPAPRWGFRSKYDPDDPFFRAPPDSERPRSCYGEDGPGDDPHDEPEPPIARFYEDPYDERPEEEPPGAAEVCLSRSGSVDAADAEEPPNDT